MSVFLQRLTRLNYFQLIFWVVLCSVQTVVIEVVIAQQLAENLIKIQADQAELDETAGTAIYQGSVELSQGDLFILADTLTVYQAAEGIQQVTALGKPAKYNQTFSKKNEPAITAKADNITYLPQTGRIILLGDAALTQGEKYFSGHRIEYDMKQHVLSASALSNDETKTEQQHIEKRVKMVLPISKEKIGIESNNVRE